MEGWLRCLVEDDEMRRLCQVLYFKTEVTDETSPVFELARQADNQFILLLETLILRAQRNKELRQNLDAGHTAIAIYAYLTGILDVWVFEPEIISSDESISGFIRILMNGLTPGDGHT